MELVYLHLAFNGNWPTLIFPAKTVKASGHLKCSRLVGVRNFSTQVEGKRLLQKLFIDR